MQCRNITTVPDGILIPVLFVYLFHTAISSAYPTSTGIAEDGASLPKQGWTSQANQRGTFDIMWDCAFTLGLCSWSILCLNVPPQDIYRWRRKGYLTCLTLLAPEWTFQLSVGQWIAARHSVKQFHAANYTGWTMKHAFFANMGGFVLQAKDSSHVDSKGDTLAWTTFPLNAEQLFYLVECRYIQMPTISKKLIKEKDKVDSAIRLLTLFQILWFTVNMSARAAQHLTITCLELTTAAFIFSAVGITFCWTHKPADLVLPEVIRTEFSIQEILSKAGDRAQEPYLRTPLDFISYREWSASLYFQHCVNILRKMRIPFGPRIVPIPAIENTFCLYIRDSVIVIVVILSCCYSALFFSAWNYSFPTQTERNLWRAAVLLTQVVMPIFWATTQWCFIWYPKLRDRFDWPSSDRMDMANAPRHRQWPGHGRVARGTRSLLGRCVNNSVSKNKKLDIPLKAILPMYIMGFLYCNARLYVFVEDFIELRLLPAKAYETVNWWLFVPHF